MDSSDIEYYRVRAAEEEKAAERATHPIAAESHRRLAEQYAALAGMIATPVALQTSNG